ncbi:translation elongation factor EF-1 subunit alpha [Thermoplasmatales archaeon SW_10_69_26]|nr:MAG: translation elongation factor EF-1 subunit alpha [Thermoplasmatales archaeon SW_10_69_26]
MADDKPHLNLVFIGHVDHGKSTTVGRLMLETGHIPEHLIENLKEEAEEKGKGGFEFAYVMDNLKEERERGVTIDIAHKEFDTDEYYFTIIDAPGHRDFVKNMITGASQADAAVLVVDAKDGVMAQTKEHLFLAQTLGVEQLIVAINKMDAVDYDEQRFEEVKERVGKLAKGIGFDPSGLPFIPVSALNGANVAEVHDDMQWADQTLLEALNDLTVPEKPVDKPLRIPIQDVYSITGIGTVPVGRIETGVLKVDDAITFQPSDVDGECKSIEMHHEEVPEAEPGDNVGFNTRGIGKDDIRRGDVAGHPDDPPRVARTFNARVIVLNHPSVIAEGYTPVFHIHTSQVACQFEELLTKMDAKTGEVKEEDPDFLKTGDAGMVKIRPTRAVSIETTDDNQHMARFAIRDMGQTVAAGLCTEIEDR